MFRSKFDNNPLHRTRLFLCRLPTRRVCDLTVIYLMCSDLNGFNAAAADRLCAPLLTLFLSLVLSSFPILPRLFRLPPYIEFAFPFPDNNFDNNNGIKNPLVLTLLSLMFSFISLLSLNYFHTTKLISFIIFSLMCFIIY